MLFYEYIDIYLVFSGNRLAGPPAGAGSNRSSPWESPERNHSSSTALHGASSLNISSFSAAGAESSIVGIGDFFNQSFGAQSLEHSFENERRFGEQSPVVDDFDILSSSRSRSPAVNQTPALDIRSGNNHAVL